MTNIDKDFFSIINSIDKVAPEDIALRNKVLQHISILKNKHDEFVSRASKEGYDLKNIKIGAVEIQFFTFMKLLSEKIGLPTEQYDKAIENVKLRTLGKVGHIIKK